MERFFEEGDKVKITLRFRGREMAHQHLGMELLAKVKAEFADVAKVESEPKLEGLQGPVVNPEGNSDVVTDQSQVDDLLASLGF